MNRRSSGGAPERYVAAAAWRLARSDKVARWCDLICAKEADPASRVALVTVLLVEMTARPALARAVEWLVALPLRSCLGGPLRARGQRMTVGPLQLRGGPWSPTAAVEEASMQLRQRCPNPSDPEELARAWNGPAATRAGTGLKYATAVRVVRAEADRLVLLRTPPGLSAG